MIRSVHRFAKDLGDASSYDHLISPRIDHDAECVLSTVRAHHAGVHAQDIAILTILPLDKVLSSLITLQEAGFINLRPSRHHFLQASPIFFGA